MSSPTMGSTVENGKMLILGCIVFSFERQFLDAEKSIIGNSKHPVLNIIITSKISVGLNQLKGEKLLFKLFFLNLCSKIRIWSSVAYLWMLIVSIPYGWTIYKNNICKRDYVIWQPKPTKDVSLCLLKHWGASFVFYNPHNNPFNHVKLLINYSINYFHLLFTFLAVHMQVELTVNCKKEKRKRKQKMKKAAPHLNQSKQISSHM